MEETSRARARARGLMLELQNPESGKVLRMVAMPDSGIDVGSIAENMGVAPHSLKLNGVYMSRCGGTLAHPISTVTWAALLSCFASRALPLHPILVHGKPSSSTSASSGDWNHDYNDGHMDKRNPSQTEVVLGCNKRRAWLEDPSLIDQAKRRKTTQECDNFESCTVIYNKKRYHEEEQEGMKRKCVRVELDSGTVGHDGLLKSPVVHSIGNIVPIRSCNSEMRKRYISDGMNFTYPCKRAR